LCERQGRGKSPELLDSMELARVLGIARTCEDNLLLQEFKNTFLLSCLAPIPNAIFEDFRSE
jgi:hypothetical protein